MITKKQVMRILDIQNAILWSQRPCKLSTINRLVERGHNLLLKMGFTEEESEKHLRQ